MSRTIKLTTLLLGTAGLFPAVGIAGPLDPGDGTVAQGSRP